MTARDHRGVVHATVDPQPTAIHRVTTLCHTRAWQLDTPTVVTCGHCLCIALEGVAA